VQKFFFKGRQYLNWDFMAREMFECEYMKFLGGMIQGVWRK
jgi:hypothetical protein